MKNVTTTRCSFIVAQDVASDYCVTIDRLKRDDSMWAAAISNTYLASTYDWMNPVYKFELVLKRINCPTRTDGNWGNLRRVDSNSLRRANSSA